MKEYFLNYEQSLKLKELGFDEECLGLYENKKLGFNFATTNNIVTPLCYRKNSKFVEHILTKESCTAPLWQQAFDWFRDKHNLCSWIYQSNSGLYHYSILKNDRYLSSGYNNECTYNESRTACIEKLIEIISSEKD